MKDKFFMAAHKGEKSPFDTYRAGLGIAQSQSHPLASDADVCDGTYA
jgi:hypothetical protein